MTPTPLSRTRLSPTRRAFVRSLAAAPLLAAARPLGAADPEPAAGVLVNHVGFAPGRSKFCLLRGTRPLPFTVAEAAGGRVAFRGTMRPGAADLGAYLVGDFSGVSKEGAYRIHVGRQQSRPFTVAAGVYLEAVRAAVAYFAKQRCGDSRTGYNAPCHLDDGRRLDDGKRHDATGGWHDACDVRKWVSATIYGMIGLCRALDTLGAGPAGLDRDRVVEEMRWGNGYFRRMQSPAGYVMNYCGGDEGNSYTDNKFGTPDDRPVHVEPCDLPAQFQFVSAQAALARLTREADPGHARGCEEAALRCLRWCVTERSPGAAMTLGAAVAACADLKRAGTQPKPDGVEDLVAGFMRRLLTLQVTGAGAANGAANPAAPLEGFFLAAPDRPEPSRDVMHGNLPLLAMCEALEQFPEHADAAAWRAALRLHADYLLAVAQRSAFGTVPFGLYYGTDPGGGRRAGRGWYRYFMKPHGETSTADWWVGINAHLASNGVGLRRAARILGDPRLAQAAQRQLDWVLGANPFDASTMTGVGANQPPLFVTGEFRPVTPQIPGGVMNGLGGSGSDEVRLEPGSYHTCEYWTPMVAYVMWLMAELQARAPQ